MTRTPRRLLTWLIVGLLLSLIPASPPALQTPPEPLSSWTLIPRM